jgi:two-component system, OmpR family, response regulator
MSRTVFSTNRNPFGLTVVRRKHILCVDDDEDTRSMMARLLDMCGYEVTTAGSLAEALPLTERGGFDMILLAGSYPDGLGIDLCKQIRKSDASTPIIFLSAYAYPADINQGLESGAQAYLTKPFGLDALEQTMEKFIL